MSSAFGVFRLLIGLYLLEPLVDEGLLGVEDCDCAIAIGAWAVAVVMMTGVWDYVGAE